jgi:Icc protein
VIVSGDLTDDGLIFQFEKAKEEIERFNCPNLIVFPGNHDYRHTGYLLFEKFFPLSSKTVQEFDNGNVIVVTVNTSRPDRDEGEIGNKQILWKVDLPNVTSNTRIYFCGTTRPYYQMSTFTALMN